MEQRPDLAARLRTQAAYRSEWDGSQFVTDLDAAAEIVEAHQRLLDAIEHPTELRVQASGLRNGGYHFLAGMLDRIADALGGVS